MNQYFETINTKQDCMNLLSVYPDKIKEYLSRLVNDRFIWRNTGDLPSGVAGIQDDTHKVVAAGSSFMQYEKIEDCNCKLYRIGFSLEEAEGIING